MKRKLVFILACYLIGGYTYLILGVGLWVLVLQLIVVTSLLFVFLPRGRIYYLAALVFLCLGFNSFVLYKAGAKEVQSCEGRWVTLVGRVESVISKDACLVSVDRLVLDGNAIKYNGKFMVYPGENTKRAVIGAGVTAEGKVKIPESKEYRNYCRGLGAEAVLYSTPYHVEFTGIKPLSIKHHSARAAEWVKGVLEINTVSLQQSEIMKGILLGGREVSDETRKKFSAVGISHLLAVSGLHVGIICGVLLWSFRKLGLIGWVRSLIVLVLLIFFSFMVGLTPSVIRATVMMGILMLATATNRKPDMLTSLSVAAFMLTVFKPYTIYSVSFQMSFLACLGIALFYPLFNRIFVFMGKYLSGAVSITLSSQILVLPLLVHYFDGFAPVSVLVNILAVPLAAVILWTAIIYIVIFGLHIPLYYPIILLNGIMVKIMDLIIAVAGTVPYGSVDTEKINPFFFAAYYLVIVVVLLMLNYNIYKKSVPLSEDVEGK